MATTAVKNAAKRKTGWSSKPEAERKKDIAAKKKRMAAAAKSKSKATTPAKSNSAVSTPTGTILDPAQWEADMNRLNIAEEDRDNWMALNQAWNNSLLEQQTQEADATNANKQEVVGYNQQRRGNFVGYQQNKMGANNALSYRGMGRSSAANRRLGAVNSGYQTGENTLNTAITTSNNNANTAISRARASGQTTRAGIATQRQALANRAAAARRG